MDLQPGGARAIIVRIREGHLITPLDGHSHSEFIGTKSMKKPRAQGTTGAKGQWLCARANCPRHNEKGQLELRTGVIIQTREVASFSSEINKKMEQRGRVDRRAEGEARMRKDLLNGTPLWEMRVVRLNSEAHTHDRGLGGAWEEV